MITNLQVNNKAFLRIETMLESVIITHVTHKGNISFSYREAVSIPKQQLENLAIFLLQANRELNKDE